MKNLQNLLHYLSPHHTPNLQHKKLQNMILAIVIFLTFVSTTNGFSESIHHIEFASQDFGKIVGKKPIEVVHPSSVSDISFVVSRFYEKGLVSGRPLKVAARGNAHSTRGQAQTDQGVVINMRSLPGPTMFFNTTASPAYVDVSGQELWINVLTKSVEYGLTPVSWTDYLYLTVGGTLSNAGISGQAFKKGPQIDSVLQLEVVTGKGELKTVTEETDYNLFYAVLGGLGQFGIITKARIALAPAPTGVMWVRALYSDFATMSEDQESLISILNTDYFDYVEGFVVIDGSGTVNDCDSSYLTKNPLQTSKFNSTGKTQYCLEVAKYYSISNQDSIGQTIWELLAGLNYIESSLDIYDATYIEFLNRMHTAELKLRKLGLWDIPHPWLHLLVPKTSIDIFVQEVFGNIITEPVNGPIIIYPFNKLIWKDMSSFVTPNENIIYLVQILSAAVPYKTGELERLLDLNKKILDFCRKAKLGVKEYLPQYTTRGEWEAHYGRRGWLNFVKNKRMYDPLAILAPGQLIFPNGTA